MKQKTYPLVLVEWEDHESDTDWLKVDTPSSLPVRIYTCGWLTEETPKKYVVTSTLARDKDCCQRMHILKSCVIRKTKISIPVKAKK